MNYLPVVNFARFIFDDSSDEEDKNIIEKQEHMAEVTVPNMDDNQFQQHFRMSPTAFEDLVNKANTILRDNNDNISNVGQPRVCINKELMVTVWCLGNLESFRSVSNRFGVTKSTCWSILYRTCHIILQVNQQKKIICWPNREQQISISNHFRSHRFNGVIGCIDGSHIKIKAPRVYRNSYINRKGYHSVLLQGVCDDQKLFMDVYAGEAGSLHDYTLYRRSDLFAGSRNGQISFYNNSYLLGDLAYKLWTNLLVGFKDNGHLTAQEKKFNRILSSKRVKIEHAFALLKGRFRRLKYMETVRMDLIPLLIVVACILHNICIFNGDIPDNIMQVDEEIQIERINRPNNFLDIVDEHEIAIDATARRNEIVNALQVEHI